MVVGDETWDAVLLVEYPSRKVFVEMVNDPGYLKVQVDREQGLERTVLYAMSSMERGTDFLIKLSIVRFAFVERTYIANQQKSEDGMRSR